MNFIMESKRNMHQDELWFVNESGTFYSSTNKQSQKQFFINNYDTKKCRKNIKITQSCFQQIREHD